MTFFEVATVLAWLGIAFLSLAVFGLSRQVAGLLTARPGATAVAQPRLLVRKLPKEFTWGPGRQAVLFVTDTCQACLERVAELRDLPKDRRRRLLVAGVGVEGLVLPDGVRTLTIGAQVLASIGISVTPYLALVSDTGEIVEHSRASNIDAVHTFLKLIDDSEVDRGNLIG